MRILPYSVALLEANFRSVDSDEPVVCIPLFSTLQQCSDFSRILADYRHADLLSGKYVAFVICKSHDEARQSKSRPSSSKSNEEYASTLFRDFIANKTADFESFANTHIDFTMDIVDHFGIDHCSVPGLLCLIRGYPDSVYIELPNVHADSIFPVISDLRQIAEKHKQSQLAVLPKIVASSEVMEKIDSREKEIERRVADLRRRARRALRVQSDFSPDEIEMAVGELSNSRCSIRVKESSIIPRIRSEVHYSDIEQFIKNLNEIEGIVQKNMEATECLERWRREVVLLHAEEFDRNSLYELYSAIKKFSNGRGKQVGPGTMQHHTSQSVNWNGYASLAESISTLINNARELLPWAARLF